MDYLYILSMDAYGAVIGKVISGGSDEKTQLTIGRQVELGSEVSRSDIEAHASEQRSRLGNKADSPQSLGEVEHEGNTHHVYFVRIRGDYSLNVLRQNFEFLPRWVVETNLDHLDPLSAVMWEKIRNLAFRSENPPSSTKPADSEAPLIARRNGQLRNIQRLLAYVRNHDGVTIDTDGSTAWLVGEDGLRLAQPRPANVDSLLLGTG